MAFKVRIGFLGFRTFSALILGAFLFSAACARGKKSGAHNRFADTDENSAEDDGSIDAENRGRVIDRSGLARAPEAGANGPVVPLTESELITNCGTDAPNAIIRKKTFTISNNRGTACAANPITPTPSGSSVLTMKSWRFELLPVSEGRVCAMQILKKDSTVPVFFDGFLVISYNDLAMAATKLDAARFEEALYVEASDGYYPFDVLTPTDNKILKKGDFNLAQIRAQNSNLCNDNYKCLFPTGTGSSNYLHLAPRQAFISAANTVYFYKNPSETASVLNVSMVGSQANQECHINQDFSVEVEFGYVP